MYIDLGGDRKLKGVELKLAPAAVEDYLQRQELALLQRLLPELFGYHLLQLGGDDDWAALAGTRISHTIYGDIGQGQRRILTEVGGARFHGDPAALPLQSESVDLVLLPHTLGKVADPRALLREVERILIPEGHLIVLDYAPYSLWGGRYRLQQQQHGNKSERKGLIAEPRLRDWMELLGMETVSLTRYLFLPPVARLLAMRRLKRVEQWGRRFLPLLCGGYLLLAKKRVSTLTPLGPSWRKRRPFLPLNLPAGRSQHGANICSQTVEDRDISTPISKISGNSGLQKADKRDAPAL
ncbi:MAG: class I SAM-dependent methyltransferase [Gammaproteobacteria bacterium]|nr:class I SAM-dependent methyltransferase [Gammaproteobacteria bacterium]